MLSKGITSNGPICNKRANYKVGTSTLLNHPFLAGDGSKHFGPSNKKEGCSIYEAKEPTLALTKDPINDSLKGVLRYFLLGLF